MGPTKQKYKISTSLFIILSQDFMGWGNYLEVFRKKVDIFYASCAITFFLYNCSVRIGTPCFFHSCFHTKFFSECNFHTHNNIGSSTILMELLKLKKNYRIIATFPTNLLWKKQILALRILRMLCYCLSSEMVLQGMEKIKPTKKIDEEIQATFKHAPVQKMTEDKM